MDMTIVDSCLYLFYARACMSSTASMQILGMICSRSSRSLNNRTVDVELAEYRLQEKKEENVIIHY